MSMVIYQKRSPQPLHHQENKDLRCCHLHASKRRRQPLQHHRPTLSPTLADLHLKLLFFFNLFSQETVLDDMNGSDRILGIKIIGTCGSHRFSAQKVETRFPYIIKKALSRMIRQKNKSTKANLKL